MNDVFIGNSIVGNFNPSESIEQNNDYKIDKIDGILHLILEKKILFSILWMMTLN